MSKIRGSEWRKWDLHFHTPSSYDYADKSITNQDIIDGLIKNQISVVAVTDHHIIDIDRIKALQELGTQNNITILPGIEFLSDSKGAEPIHFIGIFPENANLSYVWKQIESRTNIKKIEGLNKKPNEVYCDLIETAKLITELEGLVSIHAGTKSNSIENITHALPHGIAQKQDITEVINIFEIGSPDDCDGYNKHVIPYIKKTLGRHIPLIICSDNHTIKQYSVKQNLWIKADPSFEGLKQILFEPEYRVKIQFEKPEFKEERLIIDEIRFVSSNHKFTPKPIALNSNLNVIIGGKSSGKSILLYNIAKTLLADQSFLEKENIQNKYDFRKGDAQFNFEVRSNGGFSQLMYKASSENSIIPEIKYIPQNYLVKLAEPDENKTGYALNKIIRDLINEDHESQVLYDAFVSRVKSNDRKRENIIENYFEIRDRISLLDSQLKLKTSKEILEKNIQSNTAKVQELNKSAGMNDEQLTKYNNLQVQLENNKLKRNSVSNDFKKITEFNSEVLSNLISLRNKKQLLNISLENTELKQFFDSTYQLVDSLVQQVETFILNFEVAKDEMGVNRFKMQGIVSGVFSSISQEMKKIEGELQPYLKNEEIKKQIEIIIGSIGEDKTALQSINQLTKEILENKKALIEEKDKLFNLYISNHQEYIKIIDALRRRTVDLEKDGLKIEGKAAFNFPKFQKAVFGFSDGRTASYSGFNICNNKYDSLAPYELSSLISDLKAIFSSIVEKDNYALVAKTGKKNAIRLLLEDYFFDYWEIEYKDDKLGKMSTGKASFVILMLIVGLSKSKAPILIDQPEDNLDNRSITSDLVEYLKNKKLDRQIILVTHNANIVVNADAENIIIANQKGQGDVETNSPFQFDYINGALENTFHAVKDERDLLKSMGIREHIADIVEGGKIAFQKREEKYGFWKKRI